MTTWAIWQSGNAFRLGIVRGILSAASEDQLTEHMNRNCIFGGSQNEVRQQLEVRNVAIVEVPTPGSFSQGMPSPDVL
jgi:hypothetical protein